MQTEGTDGSSAAAFFWFQGLCSSLTENILQPGWLEQNPPFALDRLLKTGSCSEYPQLLAGISYWRSCLIGATCLSPCSLFPSFSPFFLLSSNTYCVYMSKLEVVLEDAEDQSIFLTLKKLKIKCRGSK